MYKKYTTPCPPVGCGEVERHLEMAQPKKDLRVFNLGSFVIQRCLFCSLLKNKNISAFTYLQGIQTGVGLMKLVSKIYLKQFYGNISVRCTYRSDETKEMKDGMYIINFLGL